MPERRASSGAADNAGIALEVDVGRTSSIQVQSAFMARQAERAHLTGLSPIEEMRIAQNELRAKAAKQIVTIRYGFSAGHCCIPMLH